MSWDYAEARSRARTAGRPTPEAVRATAGQQLVQREGAEPLGLLPGLPRLPRPVAGDNVVQVLPPQPALLQCEVLPGAEVVHPQRRRPRRLRPGRPLAEEQHVGLDPTGMEDPGRQPPQRVHIELLQQPAAYRLAGTALEEHIVRYDHRGAARDAERRSGSATAAPPGSATRASSSSTVVRSRSWSAPARASARSASARAHRCACSSVTVASRCSSTPSSKQVRTADTAARTSPNRRALNIAESGSANTCDSALAPSTGRGRSVTPSPVSDQRRVTATRTGAPSPASPANPASPAGP